MLFNTTHMTGQDFAKWRESEDRDARNRQPTLQPILWEDVEIGNVVYLNNYQDGKFPKASPRISGPMTVVVGNGCGRCLCNVSGRFFMHYPENLLQYR